ncbi:MAG: hypothetical protein A2X25_01850 [Chloroflexi bacterium GWB2_49_20]|nr:MAG: hypothetical protein A2X25_01850 [Chloroflexi bacterium GWB2_49_20]OGN78192.1 MAG: hypothetical protein A2X26_14455 [Chloroflexi bacterium GWC2_49_37]OGN85228.1 MAG: hypothetical protein A2X27_07110 [Chloroflexi bacterium GWD2_49_16]
MSLAISAVFLDKITVIMLILLPVFILMTTSFILVLLKLLRPGFRFHWLIATSGALLALIVVILWQLYLPQTFSLPAWQPQTIFLYTPTWLTDKYSWPYALSLTSLALAVILTAVTRKLSNPWNWAGILFIVSIGLLAISADNPLTLVIAWLALDFAELVTLLRSVKAEKSEDIVVAFSVRLGGVFLLLWASIISISSGLPLNFRAIPDNAGILLLLAVGLRLGVLPLHLPTKEIDFRRGMITTLRLVSAASGLSLLTRLPLNPVPSNLLPYLLLLTGLFSIIGGWIWLVSPDELNGRPFWILSLGSLSISAALFGNSSGSVAWGTILILSGGLLFIYSSRKRSNYWIPVLSMWGLSALPFSPTASVWINQTTGNILLMIPLIIGHSLILAGFFRHAITHHGDIEIGSDPRWIQVIYHIGLSVLPIMIMVLGLWGWYKARAIGSWWISAITLILSVLLFYLYNRLIKPSQIIKLKTPSGKVNIISSGFWAIYRFIRQVITLLTSILEGDGGMLWSIVLLVLFISLITQATR